MKPWACVARFGGIGDNLMAASPLPLLAQKYSVEVITHDEESADVFENNPHIAKLSRKRKSGDMPENWNDWLAWFRQRASGEYPGGMFHLSSSCEGLLAFGPGNSQFYWPAEWRRKWCNRSYIEMVHDICRVPYKFGPLFFPTDEERQKAVESKRFMGDTVIGWVVCGSRIDKVHPNARHMIAKLLRDAPVMLLAGSGRDLQMAQEIQEFVERDRGSGKGLFLARKTKDEAWPLRTSLAKLMHCDVVVTPDTGPGWAVAFEPMAKVAMLSHASPENVTKHWVNTTTLAADPERVDCWPCHQLHDKPDTCRANATRDGAACISDISVEAVVNAVRRGLEPSHGLRSAMAG